MRSWLQRTARKRRVSVSQVVRDLVLPEMLREVEEALRKREGTRAIPLTKGRVAVVDEEDYEELSRWKWHVVKSRNGREYAARRAATCEAGERKQITMHRQILGPPPSHAPLVDHKDGNGLNNRRSNLRCATSQQNNQNKSRRRSGHSSQYKGVTQNKRLGKGWSAYIADGPVGPNGRAGTRFLGNFATEEEAARAYDAAALVSFDEFAALNFPRCADNCNRKKR